MKKPGLTPRGRLVIAAATFALALLASCTAAPPARTAGPAAVPQVPVRPQASTSALAVVWKVRLGANADLGGRPLFPSDNPWNTAIDTAAVDPNSEALIASIPGFLHADFGANWNGGPFGIPYLVVKGTTKRVTVRFDDADESDRGTYPIPKTAPVEKGSDRHVLVLDRDHWRLYELFNARRRSGSTSWRAGSGAVFDLRSDALRPAGWTSADAAGLPILAGLVRYDEVRAGRITHALRFTVARTRRAYVAPARHYASDNTRADLPPMGMRVRLRSDFDLSGFPPQARVVLQAMKTYGMIVADNGSNWYVSGAPDRRWHDDDLNTLKRVPGNAFEVVAMGEITTG